MTINTTISRVEYTGNGASTAFAFPYYFLADADLVVIETVIATGVQTTKILTTHYTVSGAGNAAGGTVTMLIAPPPTVTLTIYRDPSAIQDVDLVEGDPLPVETAVERPLDKLTMIVQRLKDLVARSLRLPEGDTGFVAADMYLPAEVDRADKFLAFDANGKPIAAVGTSSTLTPVSAYIGTLLDDADGNTALTTLTATRTETGAVAVPVLTKLRDRVHVRDFGALPANTAAQNATALQAALNHIIANGGELEFEPNATYLCNAGLDFRCTAAGDKDNLRSIKGNGAIIDFSASGLTSGKLLRVGADALANASERVKSTIQDLLIIGPEDTDDIVAKSAYRDANLGGGNATAVTTIIGVSLEYATNIHLKNVYVSRVFKAFQYYYCWESVFQNVYAHKSGVGHHVDTGCTHCTWIHPTAEFCTFPWEVYPSSAGGVVISTQTVIGPRLENCTTGFVLDPGTSGTEIQNFHVINPYMENVYLDAFRAGIVSTEVLAQATVLGADRAGKISGLTVDGGRYSGTGTTTGYDTNRKAFRFAATANVASGRLLWPCAKGDIVNLPPHVSFQSLVRAEDIATQLVHTIRPGEGHAHVGSAGTLVWTDGGLISAASRASAGVYNVTLKKAMSGADNMSIQVSSRQASLFAAVIDGTTTTTNVRVEVYDAAGTLTDGKFTISVKGELAAL